MKKQRFWIIGLILITGILIAYFLFVKNSEKKGDNLIIGILLHSQNQVISEINNGFKNKIIDEANKRGIKIEFIEKNGNGDQQQLDLSCNYFINSDVHAVFAVGLPAIKLLKDKGCTKNVIFGGPPNPVGAGIVPQLNNHNTNFTGTTYFPPTDKIVDIFVKSFPRTKKLAILRNPGEPNSVAVSNSFVKIAKEKGIEIIDLPCTDGNQMDASLRSLSNTIVDGLFIPTDNLVYSMIEKVIKDAKSLKIPVFSCTKLSVQKGALFALGTDYYKVGETTAELSFPIIFENKNAKEINVLEISGGEYYVNINDPLSSTLIEINNYNKVPLN